MTLRSQQLMLQIMISNGVTIELDAWAESSANKLECGAPENLTSTCHINLNHFHRDALRCKASQEFCRNLHQQGLNFVLYIVCAHVPVWKAHGTQYDH